MRERSEAEQMDALRMAALEAHNAFRTTYERGGKRMLDLAVVMFFLPAEILLIATCAVLIWMSDGGSPFYRQRRLGRDGKVFTLWKLRTMVPNAEDILSDYLAADPAALEEWTKKQKLIKDPRVTRIGAALRKTSLDELPQIWNVLRGDMSLVGPRPMLPEQRAHYFGNSYYTMRPGVTGLWQISNRNDCNFTQRASYDTLYGKRKSLFTDLAVMVLTVSVVLRRTGC